MHRLSTIAKHTKASPRIIHLGGVNNTERDQAHRRPRKKCDRSLKTHHADLVSHVVVRYHSIYKIHPEKLKQIMKERDGQSLCEYYDSDTYKMKAVDLVEAQSRIIDELTPNNVKETIDVTYEHMLSCAQPRQKPKVFVVQDDKEEVVLKRPTLKNILLGKLLRIKKDVKENEFVAINDQIEEPYVPGNPKKLKESKKKYRKRTMILPLYLKRIHDNVAMKSKISLKIPLISKENLNIDKDYSEIPKKPTLHITKSQYRISNEEKARQAQMLLKKKVLYVDYENEMNRTGPPSLKYTVGNEEERHWYQNPMKFDDGVL